MFQRYHVNDKIQHIVSAILCEQLPYVGRSDIWVNDCWLLHSDSSGDFVLHENNQPLSYSVYTSDDCGIILSEVRRFQYQEHWQADEIARDLISKTQKYRG